MVQSAMYEGLLEAQIANAKPNANGIYIPDAQTHYAAMVLQSKIYPELLNMIRDLAGGGMIQLPSSVADFDNPEPVKISAVTCNRRTYPRKTV